MSILGASATLPPRRHIWKEGRRETHRPHGFLGWKVAESTLMDPGENFPAPQRFAGRKIIAEVSQHDRGINCVILKVYGMHKWN